MRNPYSKYRHDYSFSHCSGIIRRMSEMLFIYRSPYILGCNFYIYKNGVHAQTHPTERTTCADIRSSKSAYFIRYRVVLPSVSYFGLIFFFFLVAIQPHRSSAIDLYAQYKCVHYVMAYKSYREMIESRPINESPSISQTIHTHINKCRIRISDRGIKSSFFPSCERWVVISVTMNQLKKRKSTSFSIYAISRTIYCQFTVRCCIKVKGKRCRCVCARFT